MILIEYIFPTQAPPPKKKQEKKRKKTKKKYLKANPRCRHIDSTENEREKEVKL